jgi:poly(A) polymerase
MEERKSGVKAGALAILKRLRSQGFEAYFVGGCVRDLLLNRPIKDYDITTSATPEQIISLFERTLLVGVQFGVVRVLWKGQDYEVATFRADGIYYDGRHPSSVRYATVQEDVQRRDFTLNGLLYDPLKDEYLDYVHGRADLENQCIRTIGSAVLRFSEDKLRILRAVRFACQLQFSIEAQTWKTVCDMAQEIRQVSAERICEELSKILETGVHGFRLLRESALIQAILEKDCPALPQLKKAEEWVQCLSQHSLALHLACLFESRKHEEKELPLKKKQLFRLLLLRLKFPSRFAEEVTVMLSHLSTLESGLSVEDRASFKRVARSPSFPEALLLFEASLKQEKKSLAPYQNFQDHFKKYQNDFFPKPLLTGTDLLEQGFKASPLFQKILKDLETEQLNENLHSKEEAFQWLREKYPEKN